MVSLLLIQFSVSALAAEGDDPNDLLWERLAREQEGPQILGGSDRGPLARLEVPEGPGGEQREAERARLALEVAPLAGWEDTDWYRPVFLVRGWTRFSEGEAVPVGMLGDEEPGLLAWRAAPEIYGRSSWLEVAAAPEIRLDFLGEEPFAFQPTATRYWLGLRHGPLRVGFGAEERRLGPGRRGNLILADDAAPWPAGTVAGEGEIWKLGRFRGEVSAGWLQRERRDVNNPGMLFMDLRWSPVTWVELGASRASLFGGEGRPLPPLGQLILPTDPHIYDDPDKEQPDQDEIAALDGRLTIPLSGLWEPLRYAEFWLEYGGEDVIALSVGPIPYPSLAGVANLRGAEVAVDHFVFTVEWARLMDDYFRWYVNHRIYHEGMTQSGRSMGHPSGGDSDTWWFGGAWVSDEVGVQLWHERVWRVGVADVVEDTVITLTTDERRQRYGARGWYGLPRGGFVGLGASVDRVTGEEFVPGADHTEHRVWVEYRTAPFGWSP